MVTLRERFLAGSGCPVIDTHCHLGPFCGFHMPEASLESMVAGMERRGLESIVLSPHSALCGDTREGNREMLDAVERYPGRVYGYCTLNPNFPEDIDGEMDAYLDHPGVVGIKIHPAMHAHPVDGPNYEPVWRRANERELMLLCHTWGKSGGCGAIDMRSVAEKYPQVRLLLGHSCHGAWEGAIAIARDFPNVYLELTASDYFYGMLEWMCRDAGSEKVVYGTDYPWFDPNSTIGCVTYAHISEDDMQNILYRNARRLLDEQLASTKD